MSSAEILWRVESELREIPLYFFPVQLRIGMCFGTEFALKVAFTLEGRQRAVTRSGEQ